MIDSLGRAVTSAGGEFEPFAFQRRDPSPTDVVVEILYCGICHTDVHLVNNDFGTSVYPLVPGHEIIGRVVATGAEVDKFAVGDLAAVGCIVDSCRECASCLAGRENLCEKGFTPTYGGAERGTGAPTYGGYANNYIVDERFALRVGADRDLAATAPLLCAGVTTYSPLRHWEIGPSSTVGIVGLGGLGHVAVKIANALGASVVALTTTPAKAEDARRLGATDVVVSSDRKDMRRYRGGVDFILDTVSAPHDLAALLQLLRPDSTLCLVGIPDKPVSLHAFGLVRGRKRFAGSEIGGLPETQEMLDFCAEHDITAEIEMIDADAIGHSYQRLLRNDVRYRFVVDTSTLTP